ncbi:hypothetical protein IH575_04610 [Candidatus Dojkabacteria bacterium]|nr:hypothetical protein [Candidatus Dojkabacteria bacterium]
MKILIHGRKNGYSVLYPKPTPIEFYSFASDIQSISANNNVVYYGKFFYTLAFVNGGCIYTKYVIGDDVERGQIGEIGISVFIPITRKLSGTDVKTLLDELIATYTSYYITDNKIDEPKNGFDWLLFISLANGYDAKLLSRSFYDDTVATGTQDPAFHYYKSDNELIEHFDRPFQDEYSDYKQILFIDSNLQGIANPLNVLKNAGVEVNPDLKDEYYYLNHYNSSKGIKITANGKLRSDKKGENKIRSKWHVIINYSKDYYKPIVATGSISNPDSEIYKYLEINGSNIKIKDYAFLPEPETKTFTFEVVTKKDNLEVDDAEIKVDTQPWQFLPSVTFTAEELGREHKIAARKGDNLFSDVVKITPKDYSKDSIFLPLIEKRVVKIIAIEENGEKNNIDDFKVWVSGGKCNTQIVSEVTFTADEINTTWNITVEKDGYTRSSPMSYFPRNGDRIIYFELKKNSKRTTIHTKPQNEHFSDDKKEKPKTFTSKEKTLFSKPVVISASIVSALVLSIGIWALCHFFGNDKQPKETPHTAQQITAYVEGDAINLNTLKDCKTNWKSQEKNFITKSGGGIFGGETKVDRAKWKSDWQPVHESIEQAIEKRILINERNFAELKNLRYSTDQQSFKTAIEKIDIAKYAEFGQKLGDVNSLTLTQIADSINAILTPIKQEQQELQEYMNMEESEESQKKEPGYITTYLKKCSDFQHDSIIKYYGVRGLSTELNESLKLIRAFLNSGFKNCETFKKNASKDKFLKENQNLDSWVNKVCNDSHIMNDNQTPTVTDKTSEIIQYIKGSEMAESKLKEYKNIIGINQNLKDCIELCLKLWSLDGTRNNSYFWMQKQIDNESNYNNLKNSALKSILDKICESDTPKYWNQIPGNKINSKTLKNIELLQ